MLFREDTVARKEAGAIRNNVAYYRWTHDLVEVTGRDATAMLDRLYVNSIYKTAVGKTKYTTMLNEEGKILDDVIVMHMGEGLYWVSTLYGPQLMKWGSLNKCNFEVEFKDITLDYHMYAIQGPNALNMVNDLLETPVNEMKRFSVVDNRVDGINVKVHRSGFTGEVGYEIYMARLDEKSVYDAIVESGKKYDAIEPETLEVYVRSIPTEKGFFLRQDIHNLNPLECGLEWSVDFSKDFIGKEATLKVKADGPKHRFVGIEVLNESYEDIAQNEIIKWYGVPVGVCRSMIYGYTVDKNIGFAIVRADVPIDAEQLTVGPNDAPAVLHDKVWC